VAISNCSCGLHHKSIKHQVAKLRPSGYKAAALGQVEPDEPAINEQKLHSVTISPLAGHIIGSQFPTSLMPVKDHSFPFHARKLGTSHNLCGCLLQVPGLVNVDFADVKAVMSGAGSSLMGQVRVLCASMEKMIIPVCVIPYLCESGAFWASGCHMRVESLGMSPVMSR
jgi:hypothetical protein